MPLFWANPAASRATDTISPAMTSAADEVCATVARIFAYVGTLALLAILGVHAFDQLRAEIQVGPTDKAAWSLADRSYPAFAISKQDPSEKSATYTIFRHPA